MVSSVARGGPSRRRRDIDRLLFSVEQASLHHLKEFLRICSWCRKVDREDEWLIIEQYFDSKFNTGTSHNICQSALNATPGHPGLLRWINRGCRFRGSGFPAQQLHWEIDPDCHWLAITPGR